MFSKENKTLTSYLLSNPKQKKINYGFGTMASNLKAYPFDMEFSLGLNSRYIFRVA